MGETGSRYREFRGLYGTAVRLLAVLFVLFHLAYTGQVFLRFGMVILPPQMRAVSLCLVLVLTLLLFPATKKKPQGLPWYDVVLILMTVASTIYLLNLSKIVIHGRAYASNTDCLFAFFLFIPLVEAMRRTGATIVLIIGALFIIYAYFAQYFPGFLWGPGWGVRRLVAFLYLSIDGFYGVAMSVFALVLVPFLTFAAFLRATGVSDFFMEGSFALAGWTKGGPAKVAVVSSALFGTLSGSSIANVATTGVVTIPLMKKIGYRSDIAGAVEASASTGGQIMPPVMGATAFLMAELLGVPYWRIVTAAFVPAIFYFLFLLLSVDAEAAKSRLKGIPRDQLPSLGKVMARSWFCLVPIVALIVAMGVFYWRAEMCALLGMGLAVGVSFLRKETMMGPRRIIHAMEEGAKSTLSIGALSGGLGMIIGITGLTGLGLNLSSALVDISGGSLFILLVLTAIAAMVLGMGMPTAGVYLFCALILAPAITTLGVAPMAAHMFIFYFGLAGLVTPPVAMAAYTAAPIAGSSYFDTGWQAMRMSIPIYVVPFVFVYRGGLLLAGGAQAALLSIVLMLAITVSFVHGMTGWSFFGPLGWKRRVVFLIAGLLMVVPDLRPTLSGAIVFMGLLIFELINREKDRRVVTETG